MLEHTPIPWEISRTSDPEGGVWIEADGGTAIAHLSKELAECFSPIEANAEFIVHACNSYEALKNALSNMLRSDELFGGITGDARREAQEILRQIRGA